MWQACSSQAGAQTRYYKSSPCWSGRSKQAPCLLCGIKINLPSLIDIVHVLFNHSPFTSFALPLAWASVSYNRRIPLSHLKKVTSPWKCIRESHLYAVRVHSRKCRSCAKTRHKQDGIEEKYPIRCPIRKKESIKRRKRRTKWTSEVPAISRTQPLLYTNCTSKKRGNAPHSQDEIILARWNWGKLSYPYPHSLKRALKEGKEEESEQAQSTAISRIHPFLYTNCTLNKRGNDPHSQGEIIPERKKAPQWNLGV